jgi:hypothetical protein
MNSSASFEKTDGGFVRLLRAVALVSVGAGAVGSLGLMFRASDRTPPFLLVLFVIWVLSPFVVLAWAHMISKRSVVLTQTTLYGVTLVIALCSLAIYGNLVAPPAGSPRAFVFVAVPPASWLLMTIAVSIAALISRRRPR